MLITNNFTANTVVNKNEQQVRFGSVSKQLKQISNLTCPFCGFRMLSNPECQNWEQHVHKYTGKKLMELIRTTFKHMSAHRVEALVADAYYRLIKEKGNISFAHATNILNSNRNKVKGDNFAKKLKDSIQKVKDADYPAEVTFDALHWYTSAIKQLENGKPFYEVYRILKANFRYHYNSPNKLLYNQLFNTTQPLLDREEAVCIFFNDIIENKRKKLSKVFLYLINPFRMTVDHVLPQCRGGVDAANLIPMDSRCNTIRSRHSYLYWLKNGYIKIKRFQKLIDELKDKIKHNKAEGLSMTDLRGIFDSIKQSFRENY